LRPCGTNGSGAGPNDPGRIVRTRHNVMFGLLGMTAKGRVAAVPGGTMGSQAAETTATCELLDGRQISLRRLDIDDAEAVAALHQHLSDHDRYFRFFTLNPAHLDELVSKLIEPTVGQYALGAFDGA